MHKTSKIICQKIFKSAKISFFEKSLNSWKRVQIEFWIAEKIAMDDETWISKNHENS